MFLLKKDPGICDSQNPNAYQSSKNLFQKVNKVLRNGKIVRDKKRVIIYHVISILVHGNEYLKFS